jgi:glycosyltransferase involved in cell wall biosynthesis
VTALGLSPSEELSFASIVHVNEKGGCFGGTEEYISLLSSMLAGRGVQSHLVCGRVTGELSADLTSVHVVEGLSSRQLRPHTGEELARVVAALDADVIYVHNVFDPAVVSCLAESADHGPLIWYVHDHYLTCLSELRWRRDVGSCTQSLGTGCLRAIDDGCCVLRYPDRRFGPGELSERMSLSDSMRDADGIVVVSDYMRSLLVAAQPQLHERIHLVSRPIRDFGALRPRSRRTSADPAVITFAGRITPEKGLDVVIEALAAVRGRGPVELRIAGVVEHDRYSEHCRTLQAAAMSANPDLTVTHLGQLDYATTDDLFRQSDIVAIPSQWPEPLGAVALEAMCAGAAVIASKIGGLGTALVDGLNGLLVDPPDVAAWTAAIESLLGSPARARQLGARAHHDAAGITTDDHLRALDDIVGRARQLR